MFTKKLLCLLFFLGSASLQAETVLVQPYVQPGDGSSLERTDVKMIVWLTDQTPAEFTVEFNVKGKPVRNAKVERVALDFEISMRLPRKEPAILEREQHYFKYCATLTDLPFDAEVEYCVKMSDALIRKSVFHTRATAGKIHSLCGRRRSGQGYDRAKSRSFSNQPRAATVSHGAR